MRLCGLLITNQLSAIRLVGCRLLAKFSCLSRTGLFPSLSLSLPSFISTNTDYDPHGAVAIAALNMEQLRG